MTAARVSLTAVRLLRPHRRRPESCEEIHVCTSDRAPAATEPPDVRQCPRGRCAESRGTVTSWYDAVDPIGDQAPIVDQFSTERFFQ